MSESKEGKENYVRIARGVAAGKDGIRVEVQPEDKIFVKKDIYEEFLTNNGEGANGKPQMIIVPKKGRYHLTARGASGGYGAHAKYLGYEPGNGASIEADFDLQEGDELTIVVGQRGGDSIYADAAGTTDGATGGGGGGTFVFKKIASITDSRYQFTKNNVSYEVLLVAAGGSGTPDCRSSSGYKNGFHGIASHYYSPGNFQAYSTATNGTSGCNSISQWISQDLIGGTGGYGTDNNVYGGYGGGSQGGDDSGYFGGGWSSSAPSTTYYETTEDSIVSKTTTGYYMGQSRSFSSGEYTIGKNGVSGQIARHGEFGICELVGEGLIKTNGAGDKFLADNGKYLPDTKYDRATSTSLGLVKIGYTLSGKNYPVNLDTNARAYVNVPWIDTAATSAKLGLIKTGYSINGNNYAVALDANAKAYVNVPTATASVKGLMSAADKTKLDGVADWKVEIKDSYLWKSSSTTSANKTLGRITAYINLTLKLCYLVGNILVTGTSSTDCDVIPIDRLTALFKNFTGISPAMPGAASVGTASYYYNNTIDPTLTQYGGYVLFNNAKTALQFGRVYTETGSIGSWAFNSLNKGGIHFTAMLILE